LVGRFGGEVENAPRDDTDDDGDSCAVNWEVVLFQEGREDEIGDQEDRGQQDIQIRGGLVVSKGHSCTYDYLPYW
jgi:hypothetical protein